MKLDKITKIYKILKLSIHGLVKLKVGNKDKHF